MELQMPNIKAEVYNNNKKYDWVQTSRGWTRGFWEPYPSGISRWTWTKSQSFQILAGS